MKRLILCLLWIMAGANASNARTFYVSGAGGVPLATTDIGPTEANGILFLHGIGHGRDSFRSQFESDLAAKYHLVAFDLRGHGMSGKPARAEDYSDVQIWAKDVTSVMDATKLTKPVVVAWSYGTLVAADFIRVLGAGRISGLILVSSLGGLETQSVQGEVPADLLKARTLQPQPGLAEQQEASDIVSRYLTTGAVPMWWPETTRALNLMVPPYVQPLLRQHPSDNRDLVEKITLPVLIVYGAKDTSVTQAAVGSLLRRLPQAKASRYEASGHTPFVEDAPRFNREMSEFVDTIRTMP